jgi:hypothetical protein
MSLPAAAMVKVLEPTVTFYRDALATRGYSNVAEFRTVDTVVPFVFITIADELWKTNRLLCFFLRSVFGTPSEA